MATQHNSETIMMFAIRATNYVAKIFLVDNPADKEDMQQAAALRMIETGIISFDEARRGADAWLKAWRKRNADFSLSNRDDEQQQEVRDTSWLVEHLSGVHLSPTEWIVLQATLSGKTSRQFAAIADMSERSVWTHRQRIRRKLKNVIDNAERVC